MRPVEDPIPTAFYPAAGSQAQDLFVFLPGRGDEMEAFESNGFIDLLRAARPDVDAVVIDAHMAYYENALMADQVFSDVLKPFSQKGYRNIILVGISLGGYGALWLSSAYPEYISSVILLAPFLGMNPLVERLEDAGGISQWRAQLDHEPSFAELAWIWIDDARDRHTGMLDTAVLGYGQSDRFAGAAQLLASAIPAPHVFTADGGHNWSTWKQLWADILASPAVTDSAKTAADIFNPDAERK